MKRVAAGDVFVLLFFSDELRDQITRAGLMHRLVIIDDLNKLNRGEVYGYTVAIA